MSSVVVLGGGLAGLSAAWRLRRRGVEVVLLEASERVGGVARSERRGGYLVEHGPTLLTGMGAGARRMLADLGLEGRRVEVALRARRRYAARGGRLHELPTSPRSLLSSGLLSAAGRVRLAGEAWIPEPGGTDESLASLARRRFGAEAADYLVGPMVAGIYAGDPERLSVTHAFPRARALLREHGSLLRAAARTAVGGGMAPPPAFSFVDGVGEIAAALGRELGEAVRTGERVVEVAGGPGAWRVRSARGGETRETAAAAVVCALPADRAAALAAPAGMGALAAVRYAPIAVLHLGFRREAIAHPLDGFGFLVPQREPLPVLGAMFASSLLPGRAPVGHALLSVFLGGVRRPELVSAPGEARVEAAMEVLRPLLGVRGGPAWVASVVWPAAIPQPELGYGAVLEAAHRLEASHPGLVLAGAWRDGVSAGDAIASGLAAADRAMAALGAAPPLPLTA